MKIIEMGGVEDETPLEKVIIKNIIRRIRRRMTKTNKQNKNPKRSSTVVHNI